MNKKLTPSIIISLAAFIISLIGSSWQIYLFCKGAKVEMLPPRYIVVFGKAFPNSSEVYVRFNSRMTYVNTVGQGYSAVVCNEAINFILDKPYQQEWDSFESLNWPERNAIKNDNVSSNLEKQFFNNAQPFIIEGQSVVSHETSFSPNPTIHNGKNGKEYKYDNYLTWNSFLQMIKQRKGLALTLTSEIYSEGKSKHKQIKISIILSEQNKIELLKHRISSFLVSD